MWFICSFENCNYTAYKLHGKRRIERRLFFQPLRVHFPSVFSGFFAFVHFLDPFKSCNKLLCFFNVLCVSVHFFVSQAWQDVSEILLHFDRTGTRCPNSVQPLFDQSIDFSVQLGTKVSLEFSRESFSNEFL
jgi:hypothetical protein